jgi:hypothetical protein
MLSCVDDRFHGKKTVVRIYLGRKHRSAVVSCALSLPSGTESDTGFLMMTKALLTLSTSTRCGCERRFRVSTLASRFSTHGFAASGIVSAVQAATAFSGITASPEPTQFCGCASATGVTSATCGSACSGGSIAGTYVSVSSLATYTTLLPYPLLPSSFSLAAQATVRLQ